MKSRPKNVLTFTLIEAVELALAVNPQVLSVREKTEEFSQLVREARAEALPELTAFLSWRKTRDPGLRNSNSPFFKTIDPRRQSRRPGSGKSGRARHGARRLRVPSRAEQFARARN